MNEMMEIMDFNGTDFDKIVKVFELWNGASWRLSFFDVYRDVLLEPVLNLTKLLNYSP